MLKRNSNNTTYSNFSFLKKQWSELSILGQQAEQYAYSDPQSSIIKLRCFVEFLVDSIYRELNLPLPETNKLIDQINNTSFTDLVERPIRDKLHAIRMTGNKAAHQKGVSIDEALWLIKETYLVASWFYLIKTHADKTDLPHYIKPSPIHPGFKALTDDNVRLKEKLNTQTADLRKALTDLENIHLSKKKEIESSIQINAICNEGKLSTFKDSAINATAKIDLEEAETQRRIHIDDVFSEYTLTDGQSDLVKQLNQFLHQKEPNIFLLKGYAGTGKTFITKGLTEYFRAIRRNYILAAPTGKAAKVISSKTKSVAHTIHKTIYSFEDIKEYSDEDTQGTETYKFYSQLAINEYSTDTVYIIDESSMISDKYQEAEFFRFGSGFLLKDLIKFVNLDHNDHNKKIIFIGDNAQLPPVGMNSSPALDEKYLFNKYSLESQSHELIEVVRQKAESGVMHNSIIMREALKTKTFNQLNFDLNYPDVEHIDYSELMNSYLHSCNHKINGESIIIAHSNADVAEYNRCVRECFFPNSPELTRGDKLMAVTNNNSHGFFISNGDFGLVSQVLGEAEIRNITLKRKTEANKIEEIPVNLKFRNIEIGFKNLEGTAIFFTAKIIENLLYAEQPSLSSDESKALYIDFCTRHPNLKRKSTAFKDELRSDPYFNALRVKFGYAITCHKAQGSEWNHVFVKCKTHQNQLSEGYFRWLYTAITRTTKKLYLLDEPHLKLGTSIKAVDSQEFIMPINNTQQTENTFGISANLTFLLSILEAVRKLIQNSDIIILDIQHQQYQEVYAFQQGNEFASVTIIYNKKHKISTITTAGHTTALALILLDLLLPLKGRVIMTTITAIEDKNIEFDEPFLQQFHQMLSDACKVEHIDIVDLQAGHYHQRYSFSQAGESAIFDIHYNGKKQFTKYASVANSCTSQVLKNQISRIITDGLS